MSFDESGDEFEELQCVGERVAAHDRIAVAGVVSGTKNLMAIATCRDTDDLHRYLNEQLGPVEEILGYEGSIRTQRLKQHGPRGRPSTHAWAALRAEARIQLAGTGIGSPPPYFCS
ncbi:Lrp/AsnC ligand binding domain-containing protein [Mycobacterium sp. 94-17]|uniref:Lrp/AsnC ligand binding domain-containing protein n=1 Tax=Mycobacterium sp. 94-17 TaxID=2986147 RepID=UPI002D1F036D|nr:Lrp/AsnC ligand binding domain-containing protein [Mycobacterium sp. 94-17]MEB4211723.1 Lrp/AsnC ligand binding domain-containing protein [Mycobacterium sp. 94-17]